MRKPVICLPLPRKVPLKGFDTLSITLVSEVSVWPVVGLVQLYWIVTSPVPMAVHGMSLRCKSSPRVKVRPVKSSRSMPVAVPLTIFARPASCAGVSNQYACASGSYQEVSTEPSQ